MQIKTDNERVEDERDSTGTNSQCSSSSDDEQSNSDWQFTFDSTGRVHWPPSDDAPTRAPWRTQWYPISLHGLHLEMLDLYYWLRPSQLERALRYCVFTRVRNVLQQIWPNAKIAVFGSLYTSLFLPTSDIDVLIEGTELFGEPPLWKTAEALSESGITETVSVLDKAFVPIVKVVDKDTKIYLDISFNTVEGVRAAKFIEEMKEKYPVLEPLVLILKQFLTERQLNQVFTGGLSSYGLILMLISFLQLHPTHDYSYKGVTEVNMGVLLLNFLQLYGQEFNYMKTALRIRDGGAYVCKEDLLAQMNRPSNSMLCIEDPLQPVNDIGRCSHNILSVRQTFEQALYTLCAVFVRSPWSRAHQEKCKSTLLSRLVSISPAMVCYRKWLAGRVLTDGQNSPQLSKESDCQIPSSYVSPLDLVVTNECIDEKSFFSNNVSHEPALENSLKFDILSLKCVQRDQVDGIQSTM